MLDSIKSLLGFGPEVDYSGMVKEGAIILDVRSKGEYANGHVKGSINISLDTLGANLGKFNKTKPIITCCASGNRSGLAKNILLANGFKEVYNGGAWNSLQNKIN